MTKKYRTKEVIGKLGVCRHTLYNWFTKGKIEEVAKDRNGFRVYTEADLERLTTFKNKLVPPSK